MIKGISHITFIVHDIEKATQFFKDIFHADMIYDSGEQTFSLSKERFFLINDLWIAIMQGNSLAQKTYNHIAFEIDECDFEEYESHIQHLGVEMKEARKRIGEEGRSLYFYDYDNHLFELHTGSLNKRLQGYNKITNAIQGRSGIAGIKRADSSHLAIVKEITHQTIEQVYPHYYPSGVVSFFLAYHNDSSILKDITEEEVYLVENDEGILGTVTVKKNEIGRLYVLPQYQGNGYGGTLLDFAEAKIAEHYEEILLESSFPAKKAYLKKGYRETEFKSMILENGDALCWDIMRKGVIPKIYKVNYEGRLFVPKSNSENS